MNVFGRIIPARTLALIAGLILMAALVFYVPSYLAERRSQAAHARLDAEQGKAASDSAGDAIGTVAASGEAAAASEELTRTNERDIKAALGADVKVTPQVQAAGLRALCQRKAYADAPRCAPYRRDAK